MPPNPGDSRALAYVIARQPATWFALAFIIAIWSGIALLWTLERRAFESEMQRAASNVAKIYAQGASRKLGDIDRILKFMRMAWQDSLRGESLAALVREDFAVDEDAVQVAVIGADGYIAATNLSQSSPSPVFLGDREHFRWHVDNPADELFISRPLVGRVSGKPSIQLTRKFTDADGRLAGVAVVSLDPARLSGADFCAVTRAERCGYALIGLDRVVRAASGALQGVTNIPVRPPAKDRALVYVSAPVEGFPLYAVAAMGVADADAGWSHARTACLLAGLLITALAAFVGGRFALKQDRYERHIIFNAEHDALTMLGNRASLQRVLRDIQNDRRAGDYALHLMDLDGFKAVNDTYGHPVGDKPLRQVGDRLRESARDSVLLARLGGDEFAIVSAIEGATANPVEFARELIASVSRPYFIDGSEISVRASVGVALASQCGRNRVEWMKAADLALYEAKDSGRGAAFLYTKRLGDRADSQAAIEKSLKDALEKNQFELHYQPIVSALTEKPVAYEALLRWRHPANGLVAPMTFIPIAESTGLIIDIGEWVIETVCRDMARLPPDARVAVNCSAVQFERSDLVRVVEAATRKHGLSPRRLEIEITETMLIRETPRAKAQLQALRDIGVMISMDDFGTGYASLGYLELYPIDGLKIDRSFVAKVTTEPRAQAIVKTIVDLATTYGMTTVAEGVETSKQRDMLTALGCDRLQGYYFGRPEPLAGVEERIHARAA